MEGHANCKTMYVGVQVPGEVGSVPALIQPVSSPARSTLLPSQSKPMMTNMKLNLPDGITILGQTDYFGVVDIMDSEDSVVASLNKQTAIDVINHLKQVFKITDEELKNHSIKV